MDGSRRRHPPWDIVQTGPADAEHTVLLLPGGWCTALFYEELMAEPALAGVRLVAVTLPGNGGTPAPEDVSIENYARLTAELAADSTPTSSSATAGGPTSRSRWRVPARSPDPSCCSHPPSRARTRR